MLTLFWPLAKLPAFKELLQTEAVFWHVVGYQHQSSTEAQLAELPEPSSPKPSPMSLALEWVARITAISLLMFLPGVGGDWLDKKLGTNFLALVGFGFGLIAGIWILLVMVRVKRPTG